MTKPMTRSTPKPGNRNRTVKLGRPPKLVDGLTVGQLETFSARMTPTTKARLLALSATTKTPAYALLEAAFFDLWQSLPPDQRRAAEQRMEIEAP